MEPLPVGAPGELWLGGTGLARGYLQQPRLTAERFVPDPRGEEPGARAYRTGDLGRWLPDGEIEFLGRADHQVKLGGFRIELQEIEDVAGAHPGVSEVAALVREDVAAGPRLVLYVAGRREAAPSSAELRAFLAERLPEYMVPSHVVALESMPLNPNGKVDRAALPAPARGRPDSDRRTVPPRDELERGLAAVWREMLGIEEIGVHDNFFHLGGSSLLLIQTHRRQRTALGADLTLAEFFQNPTIAALAEALRRGRRPDAAAAGTLRAGARKSSARHAARARALRRESRR
jgi:aryl carrier-like protein